MTDMNNMEEENNMENLADDALNEFGMKYDGGGQEEDGEDVSPNNSPNNSPIKVNAEGSKEAEGKTKEEKEADDEGKFGEENDEDEDEEEEELNVGQKSNNIDLSGGNNNSGTNQLWGYPGFSDPYAAFKMQDKTPQELAEEAAQQQAMWVAYVEELSEALSRRQNIVVTSNSKSDID